MDHTLEDRDPLENYPAPPPRSEDLPYDNGEPLESNRHRLQMNLLLESLDRAWAERDDYFAGGNMSVYFSETHARQNDFPGPDVFVVLNTYRRDRRSWVVWEEEGRTPDVIIELLSPQTEHVDRGEKMNFYARTLKVSTYYLYDPWTFVLEGYTLDETTLRYRRIDQDADGLLPCDRLELRLGVFEGTYHACRNPWLRWVGRDGPLPTNAEACATERQRANAEKQRADAEKQRADAEQQRADAEQQRADAEQQRANTEKQRADAEKQRADALEAQLAAVDDER